MRISILTFFSLLLLGLFSACSPQEGAKVAPEALEFHIGPWTRTIREARLGYTMESSWPLLREWYGTGALFTLDLNDIESYDWGKHEMWLTPGASAKFMPNMRSTIMGPTGLMFVVTANGQPLYGGMFLYHMSAMAINYPVIYTDTVGERIRFTIRPIHSIHWQGISAADWNAIRRWNGMDSPAMKRILFRAGKLKSTSPCSLWALPWQDCGKGSGVSGLCCGWGSAGFCEMMMGDQ